MVKSNVYDKIMIQYQKRENMEVKEILHKSPSKLWLKNGTHS